MNYYVTKYFSYATIELEFTPKTIIELHSCIGKVLRNVIIHIQYVCSCIAIKYLVQSKIIGVNCYFLLLSLRVGFPP